MTSLLYKKHIKACNEASKHISNKSCKICQKTFQKLSEIYIHILEKHSQSLEVENVVDDGIIPANEDTIHIPNTSTKVSDEKGVLLLSVMYIWDMETNDFW